jgi:hypothetical protein
MSTDLFSAVTKVEYSNGNDVMFVLKKRQKLSASQSYYCCYCCHSARHVLRLFDVGLLLSL